MIAKDKCSFVILSVATLMRGKGEGVISSTAPNSFPYLTSEMEPLALKSLVSKINILPHLYFILCSQSDFLQVHIRRYPPSAQPTTADGFLLSFRHAKVTRGWLVSPN